jgi:hypothetical protein
MVCVEYPKESTSSYTLNDWITVVGTSQYPEVSSFLYITGGQVQPAI